MPFELPKLDYTYDALEPNFDGRTMEIHYTKHHQAYVNNLNKLSEGTEAADMDLDTLMKNISKFPTGIRNNGGGHYNHSLWWKILSPNGGAPSQELTDAINKTYGSMDAFREEFNNAGMTRFGSGWAWLCVGDDGNLFITSTANQDNPVMDIAEKKGIPLMGCDVWEHAYYLLYQNRRNDYMAAFWNVLNWNEVNNRYAMAIG